MSKRQARNAPRRTPSASESAFDEVRGDGPVPSDANRRDFLKLAGFSFAALAVPGCSRSDEHRAIPFLEKPEEVTPGRANWFATLCGGCEAGCGILAKYRDGRPIKVEGNAQHPLSGGGVCAVGQAGVLSLFDSHRLAAPHAGGSATTWENVDAAILEKLDAIQRSGGAVRVLSGTVNGPTTLRGIETFVGRFADGRHVMYDALSSSALLDAYGETFGRRVLPHYRFERARVIASFDADFLGTWISPVEFTRGYRAGRSLDAGGARFSKHFQWESRLSLTGCSADRRVALAPDAIGAALTNLAAMLAKKAGRAAPWSPIEAAGVPADDLAELADALWSAPRGETLVVCGTNRVREQKLVAWINDLLGNHGGTESLKPIDMVRTARQRLGSDAALAALRKEIASGKVAALITVGCNPVYDLPDGAALGKDLEKVGLVVSCGTHMDETASASGFACPDHHALESWREAEPVEGTITVSQPVVRPLRGTRAFVESLAAWGRSPKSAYDQMRGVWEHEVFPRQSDHAVFARFWDTAVHDGFANVDVPEASAPAFKAAGVGPAAAPGPLADGMLHVVLHPKVAMGDGRHAENPWLQELPDPVSKVAWDNYAALAPGTAARMGVETGDVLKIEVRGRELELPALVQPGQHESVVAIALGYGRLGTDRFSDVGPEWIEGRPTVEKGGHVGVNAAPLLDVVEGQMSYDASTATVSKTFASHALAKSQLYDSLQVPKHLGKPGEHPRPIAQETTLDAWRRNPAAGGHAAHAFEALWPDDHKYEGHHWHMAIDLTACTGCSACVIACQAENNVPVVGKDEVRRKRDMAWIRIDRYYGGHGDDVDVIHQPMLCQHCDNAPCESVCPVLATVHSSEGLNQQVYNRCVGTRYCSNNCPYKVRKFNWFAYAHDDKFQNMVLNPDVSVRSRGVMEKCSFCVQRIQEAKLEARRLGRPVADGDVRPACMQSCPADAIGFGDDNDKESAVRKKRDDPRSYRVLAELDVRPSVSYMRRIRNRKDEDKGEGESHG